MGCCGQKRQAWRERTAFESALLGGSRPQSPAPPVLQNPRVLRHQGAASLLVKGAVTGHVYLFAGGDAELSVDERDVPALLKMGLFTAS